MDTNTDGFMFTGHSPERTSENIPEEEVAMHQIRLHLSDADFPKERAKLERLDGPVDGKLRNESRTRVRWESNELKKLIEGVEKFGLSSWRKILDYGAGVFNKKRRPIDLVDKYRQYTKSTSFYTTAKRNWIELDEHGNAKQEISGEVVLFREKFPYDAALRFAKRVVQSVTGKYLLRIQDAENAGSVHIYEVRTMEGGRIKLRKILVPRDPNQFDE